MSDEFEKENSVQKDSIQPVNDNGSSSYSPVYEDEGSGVVGFILVFFLSWIGLIIAIVMKKRKTTKAAIITFIVEVALGIIIGVIVMVLVFTNPEIREQLQAISSGTAA